jgi:hypothetical protein
VTPFKNATFIACLSAVVALFALIQLASGLVGVFASKHVYVPLVGKFDWRVTGDFPSYPLLPSPLEIPPAALRSTELALSRSWSHERGAMAGSIETGLFARPDYLAVPHHGFPGEGPGNRIILRCESTSAEMDIATTRTNTQWATAFIAVPRSFCPGLVKLIAASSGASNYVGVGTPFAVSKAVYRAHTSFAPRVLVVVGSWGVLSLFVISSAYLTARFRPRADPLVAGFVGIGVSAMAAFTAFTISPAAGTPTAVCLAVLAAVAVVFGLWMDAKRFRSVVDSLGFGLLFWLGVALAYAALVSGSDSGGGSWHVNGLYTPLRWSSDNQLPFIVAEGLYDGTPRAEILKIPWQTTDRTPLLSAILLIVRCLIIAPLEQVLSATFVPIGYMMAGLTVLSAWVAALVWLCRGIRSSRFVYVLALSLTSSFLLFNSVYIWPKMLGATYVVFAFGLLYRSASHGRVETENLVLLSCCASLAYLSHASNGFAVVPLALIYVRTIVRSGLWPILAASACAAAIYAPWLYWQTIIQPYGNVLLRFALADEFGFDKRRLPILRSIKAAYNNMTLSSWLEMKLQSLQLIMGLKGTWNSFGETALFSKGAGHLGQARVLDFFVPIRSVGFAVIGLAFLPFMARREPSQRVVEISVAAALVGFGGLMLVLLVALPPPITHHLPYGSILLLMVAGGLALSAAPTWLRWPVLATSAAYFLTVWVWHPLAIADRLHWPAVYVLCEVAIALCLGLVFATTEGNEARGSKQTADQVQEGSASASAPAGRQNGHYPSDRTQATSYEQSVHRKLIGRRRMPEGGER